MRKKGQHANIERLIELFEKRERLYQQTTGQICELLGPTALEALIEVFDAPYENVTWLEVQLVEDVLLIVASIAYDEGQKVPPAIQELSPLPEDEASIRLFRIGLPVELIFQPKVEILEYLSKAAQLRVESPTEKQSPITPKDDESFQVPVHSSQQPEFDTSELSHEQIQQLLLAGINVKGTIH